MKKFKSSLSEIYPEWEKDFSDISDIFLDIKDQLDVEAEVEVSLCAIDSKENIREIYDHPHIKRPPNDYTDFYHDERPFYEVTINTHGSQESIKYPMNVEIGSKIYDLIRGALKRISSMANIQLLQNSIKISGSRMNNCVVVEFGDELQVVELDYCSSFEEEMKRYTKKEIVKSMSAHVVDRYNGDWNRVPLANDYIDSSFQKFFRRSHFDRFKIRFFVINN